ncbi:MAG: serine protease [Tistlia sp.]|uniref:serine protease n=1 Tax=Tistlia sp. TaxID=3057121 RepID=UPI0034A47145
MPAPRLRLSFALLALALPALLAGAPAEAGASALVDCLDSARQVVLRALPWQCQGRVLTPEEAEARRAEIREQRLQRLQRSGSPTRQPQARPVRTGTGFRVDSQGHVLTNRHVVEGCRRLDLVQDGASLGEARLLALHPQLDMALLATGTRGPHARFAGPPRPAAAAPLSVVGYPAQGLARREALLSSVVAESDAMAGAVGGAMGGGGQALWFRGDVSQGGSGSPLLDESGRVVGMVSAKRDQVKTYAATGELPPAGGLALPARRLVEFLTAFGVAPQVSTEAPPQRGDPLLESARSYVLRIDCRS